ncbi:bi-functional transferase/deacetylase [Pilimelia terevasa]|uniref:Bi-functional transferase/deacetylase n=1 Tax=Pilimelia terevasa TaxID=53372 RepID=A0A8J3FEY4_9ACTN|nr:bifunctional polysaccharide deacetylase/glycosyltransferase family 2 protein [Pilimelia terevasa]GGK17886.1 bi-functional transferase/deacetylase [Pilimelia terevasa]
MRVRSRRDQQRAGRTSAVPLALGLLVAIAGVLAVNAYLSDRFTPDHEVGSGATATVPAAVQRGGPLLEARPDGFHTYPVPDRTLVLTFDDGPDPTWTPKVADVLYRHGVRATFFVVGGQVAKHPDLVRRLVAEGHEIGVHSFSHPQLAALPAWRRELEHSQTQIALAGAAGITTKLVRFPYSSVNEAIDDVNWPVYREAGADGYLNVLSQLDSRDWARPGEAAIVRNMTPAAGRGGVVLLHDAGGDRSQTVAALDQFLGRMRAEGYRFSTPAEVLSEARLAATTGEAPPPTFRANPQAPDSLVLRGEVMLGAITFSGRAVALLLALFLLIGLLAVARMLLLVGTSVRHLRIRRHPDFRWGPPVTAPVSIIVPAYNEAAGIAAAVRSLATGDHPGIEVVVVDDGSTDDTAAIVRGLGLPNVRLVSVPNGGKAAALNIGVDAARHDLIVMVDGDTVFEPESVRRLVQPFADPTVGGVSGNVKVGNRRGLLARWQHIEYVMGFSLDRRLYDVLQIMPTVPGAIGAFRRQTLRQVGGVSDDTLAEDTDLTMAVTRAGWRVVYEESARAWTEVPTSVRQLWSQRYRWGYGTIQSMWKHRHTRDDGPAGRRFGRVGLPMLVVFQVFMPLVAGVIDLFALYGLFFYDLRLTAVAWGAMLAAQLLTAAVAFRLDGERLRVLWLLPLQQLVYRQLMYLVVVRSVVAAVSGARMRWHKLRRAGNAAILTAPAPTPAAPGVPVG